MAKAKAKKRVVRAAKPKAAEKIEKKVKKAKAAKKVKKVVPPPVVSSVRVTARNWPFSATV